MIILEQYITLKVIFGRHTLLEWLQMDSNFFWHILPWSQSICIYLFDVIQYIILFGDLIHPHFFFLKMQYNRIIANYLVVLVGS